MKASEIKTLVRNWVLAETPETVKECIFEKGDGPRPAKPFVTLLLSTMVDAGFSEEKPVSNDGIIVHHKDKTVSVSVQVFGGGAMDIGQDLFDSLVKYSVLNVFRAAGLVYVRPLTGPSDVGILVATKYEPRAHFDLEFRVGVDIEDDVGIIETVIGTGTYRGENSSKDVDFEITTEG